MEINLDDIKPLQQNLEFAKEIFKYQVNYSQSGVYLFHDDIEDTFSNQFIQLTNDPLDLNHIKKQFLIKNKKVSIVIPSFLIFQPLELLRANSMEVFAKEVYMAYEKELVNKNLKPKNNLKIQLDLDGEIFKEIFTKVYSSPPTKEHPYGGLESGYLKLIDNSYLPHNMNFKVQNYVAFLNNNFVGCVSLVSNQSSSFIYNLGTDPNIRNQGIGTDLINYAISAWEKEIYNENLYLVTPKNGLEEWYTRLGFRTIFDQDIYREKSHR